MTRHDDWFRQIAFPAAAKTPLGSAYETWLLDPARYEGSDDVHARGLALGRRWGKRDLAYRLAAHLLTDVVAAAGGTEQAIATLRSAIAETQAWCDEHGLAARQPGVPHGVGHPGITAAWYEFANLLTWARAVEERMDRRAPRTPRGVPPLPRQGLVNAVKPARLKKRSDALLADLRAGPLAETRLLANFTLHAALIRDPHSGGRLDGSGKIHLPLPDPPAGPVYHIDVLTWNQNRDVIRFAEDLWASIEQFIDGLLAAFEKAVPRRLRS